MNGTERPFLVGAASAAHQTEGNNVGSDFWAQERMAHSLFAEPSGKAVDHYHRFREDVDLLRGAGLNAFRFSIEWARVEPEPGYFDEAAIAHYEEVLKYCLDSGVAPVVTLHHFSSPLWLIREGGWEADTVVERFRDYAVHVVERLGRYMGYVCTINEANMGLALSVFRRSAEQGANADVQTGINADAFRADAEQAARKRENLEIFGTETPQTFLEMRTEHGDALILQAHCAARDAIKARFPELKVGLTLTLTDFQPQPGGEEQSAQEWESTFLHYLPGIAHDDFLGVQNYTRKLIGPTGFLPIPPGGKRTQMGFEYYPRSVGNVLRKVAERLSIPLMVTENGVAVDDDADRVAFVREATKSVREAIAAGVPVLGYLYWSLTDNFEWQKGYRITFGLVGVDRATQKREPRPSLYALEPCFHDVLTLSPRS